MNSPLVFKTLTDAERAKLQEQYEQQRAAAKRRQPRVRRQSNIKAR